MQAIQLFTICKNFRLIASKIRSIFFYTQTVKQLACFQSTSNHSSVSWAPVGLNFNAINLNILQIVGLKVVYNIFNLQINNLKIEVSTSIFIPQKILHILDQLGLSFNAINLKFLQIVGHKAVYNIYKFQINSLTIEVRTNFY